MSQNRPSEPYKSFSGEVRTGPGSPGTVEPSSGSGVKSGTQRGDQPNQRLRKHLSSTTYCGKNHMHAEAWGSRTDIRGVK